MYWNFNLNNHFVYGSLAISSSPVFLHCRLVMRPNWSIPPTTHHPYRRNKTHGATWTGSGAAGWHWGTNLNSLVLRNGISALIENCCTEEEGLCLLLKLATMGPCSVGPNFPKWNVSSGEREHDEGVRSEDKKEIEDDVKQLPRIDMCVSEIQQRNGSLGKKLSCEW